MIDLTQLSWELSGWIPYQWRLGNSVETGEQLAADVPPILVKVPISVQKALKDAGILPDWNVGLNYRQCEWVENRQWRYSTEFSVEESGEYEFRAEMLDNAGWIVCDGKIAGEFSGGLRRQRIKLGELHAGSHKLAVVFDMPARWLGQFGYTSKMPVNKARFNYTWDWTIRLVQCGIGGEVAIHRCDESEILLQQFDTTMDSLTIQVAGRNVSENASLELVVGDGDAVVLSKSIVCGQVSTFENLDVVPWQPNGAGVPKLYSMTITKDGKVLWDNQIGFRTICRKLTKGAPEDSYPWLFEINGVPTFLQGFNWTPLLPNTIDVPDELYRERIEQYRTMGVNILRVWGGARREKEIFYRLCDENGIMLWQELPLSSSGLDNTPPTDTDSMKEMERIVKDSIDALIAHPSLVIWGGGNELYYPDGFNSRPCDGEEPMLAMMKDMLAKRDPKRGFLPTSPSGKKVWANDDDYGKHLHQDIHGPWKVHAPDPEKQWREHWMNCDAMMASEFGSPGACDLSIIRQYAGELKSKPFADNNPFWCRPIKWHAECECFKEIFQREPLSDEEYVAWSQARQARAIEIVLLSLKRQFPACGGAIIWDGHDDFPCPSNCSVIDFHGNLKPAASVIRKIFMTPPQELPEP